MPLRGHSDTVRSVAINSDCTYICSGSDDKIIKKWSLQTGELIKTMKGHSNYVNSVAISSDDKFIISGSRDDSVKVWSFETGSEL